MAGTATFESHGRVFIYEGTAHLGMAVYARRFVAKRDTLGCRALGTVGIVAVDASHGALGEGVRMRTLKLGALRGVATGALSIRLGLAPFYELFACLGVDCVALAACYLTVSMAGVYATYPHALVTVATQTSGVFAHGRGIRRIGYQLLAR
jgi:hypothetical protein